MRRELSFERGRYYYFFCGLNDDYYLHSKARKMLCECLAVIWL